MIRLVIQLIRLQRRYALRHWQQHLALAVAALVGFLVLLVLAGSLIVVPAGRYLQSQYLVVDARHGSAASMFFVAMVHVLMAFLLVAPFCAQMQHILDSSLPLRIFHNRARSPVAIAITLQIEALAFMLGTEVLLFPLGWMPFLSDLGMSHAGRLMIFKCTLWGVLLTLVTCWLWLRLTINAAASEMIIRWSAGLAYLGIIFWLGGEVYESIRTPSPDQVLVHLLKGINNIVADEHVFTLVGTATVFWVVTLPTATGLLQKAIRKHGL